MIAGLTTDLVSTISDALIAHGSPLRLGLPARDLVFVSNAADVERIFFTGQDVWQKGPEYDIPAIGLRQGLVTSRGERWRRDRTMLNPLFSKRALAPLAGDMIACAAATADRLLARGGRVDVLREMSRLALDVACSTMFGGVLADEDAAVVSAALDEALAEMYAVGQSPLLFAAGALPGPPLAAGAVRRFHWRTRRVERQLVALDRVLEDIIARRRADPDAPKGDFLDQLLTARDEATGQGLAHEEIIEQAATFLLAGHETTATALTWTWHLLAENPDARDRLHDELDAVLGARAPELADLEALPWTRAVFSESLRLRPPVFLSLRRAFADDELSAGRVRRDSIAVVFTHLLHRDPEMWPDPHRFDPSRFLPGVGADRPRGAYAPFGGGKRVCIGTQFSVMEGVFALATLGRRLQLDSAPDWVVAEEMTTTLRPRGGLPMLVRGR